MPPTQHLLLRAASTMVTPCNVHGCETPLDSPRNQHLVVPFSAVTGFADPSVQFGLQFKADWASIDEEMHDRDEDLPAAIPDDEFEDRPAAVESDADSADVVVLDRFRNK